MRKSLFCLLLILAESMSAWCQPKSNVNFRSLQIGRSAREAALGGKCLASTDKDFNLAFFTPSLLDSSMSSTLAFNYVNYFADINFGYAAYAHKLKALPITLSGGIRFFDYGKFDATDEFFNTNGTFHAGEYALQFGGAWQLDSNWTVGTNLKFILANYTSYKASALATDLSVTYINPKHLFAATLIANDLGFMTKNFTETKGALPFDIALGLSKKLAKSPLRFSVVADNLTTWDLTYTDPNAKQEIDPLTNQPKVVEAPSFGNKLFRHIYGGTEIVLSKSFHIRAGYNYRRRQELKIAEKPGTAGISWGFAFRVSKFHFSYARTKYHLASPSNHFTVSTNLSTFGKN